jgi:hypothetical protein
MEGSACGCIEWQYRRYPVTVQPFPQSKLVVLVATFGNICDDAGT